MKKFLCSKKSIKKENLIRSFSYKFSQNNFRPKLDEKEAVSNMENIKHFLNESIDKSIPKIQNLVESLSKEQIECLKCIQSGGISHGAISFPAHVSISSGINLLSVFLWGKENKNILRLIDSIGPKETFEMITNLSVFYGSSSIFNGKKVNGIYFENKFTDKLIKIIGRENALELLNNLPEDCPTSNSGEGGEMYTRDGNIQQSLRRQIASGRFGVNLRYIANARFLEIKVSQGAKPGVGGMIPALNEISIARGSTPGIALISPPPHHDIYSIEDLRQLIYDLRSANPHAKISVKLASNQGCSTVALGVAKCYAKQFENDKINITIAGPGGTGAATLTDKHEINMPYEIGLLEAHQVLLREGLRDRVTLTASGGIQTGLDAFKALLLGSNYIELGTSILVSLGCFMAKVCHEDTCPTGIATTNYDIINSKFKGTPDNVARFLVGVGKSMESYMKLYGIKSPKQAVGRTDLLKIKKDNIQSNFLRSSLDKVNKLVIPENILYHSDRISSSQTEKEVIERIEKGEKNIMVKASNRILSFGARIGYYDYYKNILKEEVVITFTGLCMGQSLGFLLPKKLILVAENANDSTGKSLCGGEIYIKNFTGNCLGYGATEGFIGVGGKGCGDRALIRLSGYVRVVVRRTGESACNFMTGGRVTIIGDSKHYEGLNFKDPVRHILESKDTVGANFGSGFTGGKIILPWILHEELKSKGYLAEAISKIETETLNEEDIKFLVEDLEKYSKYIEDGLVKEVLENKENLSKYFLKLEARPPKYDKSRVAKNENLENINFITQTREAKNLKSIVNLNNSVPLNENSKIYKEEDREKDSCGVGLIVKLDHKPDRGTVEKITDILANLWHRGSVGIDLNAGDGCGITWYGLRSFFQKKFPKLKLEKGKFGVINMSTPISKDKIRFAVELLFKLLGREKLAVSGQRECPINPEVLGNFARENLCSYHQFIIVKPENISKHTFENSLARVRLRFEFILQGNEKESKNRAHITSASSYYVTITSLVQGQHFKEFFLDLKDPDFTAYAAIAHERFATNTQVHIKNVQPLPRIANNGENNNLKLIELILKEDPSFENILGIRPDFSGMSDSAILSTYLDYYILKYFEHDKIEEENIRNMVMASIQSYIPENMEGLSTVSKFYNIFGVPFEGPNASVITVNHIISLIRDRNGFRPLVGIVNDDYIYAGSEIGTIDIKGEIFRLQPGRALFINLDKGNYSFSELTNEKQKLVGNLWKESFLDLKNSPNEDNSLFKMTSEQLKVEKLRAGWSEEVDKHVMKRLFKNEPLISSMADHGPPEHFVSGPFLDINAHFKGKFAQVTNPPLAKREEICYMSTITFVGEKPEIYQLNEIKEIKGIIINSPIVDNNEIEFILKNPKLNPAIVGINYPLRKFERGMNEAINDIVTECLRLVLNEKKNLLILSDLANKNEEEEYGPIPSVLICSLVEKALLKVGLRRKTAICLQAADMLTGAHIAQAISIGGADIVNPYLPFIIDLNDISLSIDEINTQHKNYKESLRQELLGFMARMGISSVTAYRGAKIFEAEGLDQELASMYNVRSRYSGIGLHELSHLVFTKFKIPRKNGLGRYDEILRKMIWRPEITQYLLKAIKNESDDLFNKYEQSANQIENSPTDWIELVKPTKWTSQNPLPVCIVGGGAAGFLLTQKLIESNIPVKVTIIERNLVNKVGLIGDGVAPDHPGTRKQAELLKEILNDDRVEYYGGIDVIKDLTINELRKLYPCIFDSRGSNDDVKLNIPGDSYELVIPASRVYRSYNATFNPNESTNSWPLNQVSVNPAIGLIGMGNVAADIIRILFSNPDNLEHTSINQNFLQNLREYAPPIIYVFARGDPTDCKIGLKELEELSKLDIWMTAIYDTEKINHGNLSQTQKKYLEFFNKIHNRNESEHYEKRLYFFFQHSPQKIHQAGNELELFFKNQKDTYVVKNLITCLGRKPSEDQKANVDYIVGWASGKGGNLLLTEESVNEIFNKFKSDFQSNKFHATNEDLDKTNRNNNKEFSWKLKSLVYKQEFLNIFEYLKNGKQINTIEDFQIARNSKVIQSEQINNEPVFDLEKLNLETKEGMVTVYDYTNNKPYLIQPDEDSLLNVIKKISKDDKSFNSILPEHECDGVGTCGTCFMRLNENDMKDIQLEKKERDLLRINGVKFGILTCQHKCKNLTNKVLFHNSLNIKH